MHDIDVRNSYAGRGTSRHPGGHGPDKPAEIEAGQPARAPAGSRQDQELLLLDAESVAGLRGRIARLAELAGGSPRAELGDLAARLRRELTGGPLRAAVVAASADQAAERLSKLLALLDSGAHTALDVTGGIFAGQVGAGPRIGYLFPGQGSGKGNDGGALAQRFETVRDLYRTVTIPAGDDPAATAVAQPRIALSSVAGLRVLSLLGIEATAAVGHSLGELTALHWAGAMSESALLALAKARGQIMTDASPGGGAMAGIAAGSAEVEPLLAGEPVVIAGYNGPNQTVVAGPAEAVERVRAAAAAGGLKAVRIAVSDAFHSPAMAPAADGLRAYVTARRFRPLAGRVLSTVTGDVLPADADLPQLLVDQLCEPVRFSQALSRMAAEVSLLIEVGPGRVLAGLAAKIAPGTPVIPLATDGASLSGLLSATAAAYVLGAPVRHDALFSDRNGPAKELPATAPERRPAGVATTRPAHFVSRLRVRIPGREVVADAELSADGDPYLTGGMLGTAGSSVSHHPGTDVLPPGTGRAFPAMLALEAMAQVAAPLSAADRVPDFENIEFLRPVVIPAGAPVAIRITARREGDSVNAAIRSADTSFQVDHVRATLRYTGTRPPGPGPSRAIVHRTRFPLDQAQDLQGERSRRVLGYRRLAAKSCVAEVSADDRRAGSHHASELVLGDPGTRDAIVAAIQGCVPDATLLPAGVGRLYPARLTSSGSRADSPGQVIVHAVERHRAGDAYTYDLDVYASGGRLLERWQDLRLVAVRQRDGGGPWAPVLLGPYLERRLAELVPHQLRCTVKPDGGHDSRQKQTAEAVCQMLGRPALVWHRGDGRPEIAEEGVSISAAHGAGVLLTVLGTGRIGSDARAVVERPAGEWQALLDPDQVALAERIARALGESRSVAVTRIRGAAACLQRAGWSSGTPLTLVRSSSDGWALLSAGRAQIATFHTHLRDNAAPAVFTIMTEKGSRHESLLRVPPRRGLRGDRPRRQRLSHQPCALEWPVPGNVLAGVRTQRARPAPRRPRPGHHGR